MSIIAGAISGALAPVIEGIISRRPAAGAPPADNSQAEIAAMLELGGDTWTLNSGGAASEAGVYNGTVATGSGLGVSGTGIVGNCYRATTDGVGWNFDTSLFSTVWAGGDWSVACWIKNTEFDPDASDMRFLVFGAYCDTGSPIAIDVYQPASSGTPYARVYISDVGEANAITRDTNITNNAWTLLTVVYTSSNRTLSVRLNAGAETTDVLGGATSTNFSAEAGKGIDSCAQYISGAGAMLPLFDELLLVPSALTLTQIEWLYNSGAGRSMSVFAP